MASSYRDQQLFCCGLCGLKPAGAAAGGAGGPAGAASRGGADRLCSEVQLLPCLHAVCRRCLELQLCLQGCAQLAELQCPSCTSCLRDREPDGGPQPPLLTAAPDLLIISNILEVVKEEEEESGGVPDSARSNGGRLGGRPGCSSCDEGSAATSHCLDCQEDLCDRCVKAHQRVRLTKEHLIQRRLEPRQAVRGGFTLGLIHTSQEPQSQERTSYCQQHQNEASYPPSSPPQK
ncbi:E3 ubiquitin-protein ligase TRIM71-like [Latimeria chalumnae]|uniref:E3 ubiquitin-protein ligase TRIM71-like n=1 Tax=Latimeria chalumnae TaxID=7897 RepID=UPI00313C3DDE